MVNYICRFFLIMLAALPVYLLICRPWRQKSVRAWVETVFVVFMMGLLTLVLEGNYASPREMVGTAAERIDSGLGINLVPLRTVGSYFAHFSLDLFMINITGNIVMFVPWGFGLPLLWKRKQRLLSIAAHCLALPVLIEACQLFVGRSVDVDDVILNFAGGCLGACLYFLLRRLAPGVQRLAR